jgi:hypothetical protein
LLMSDSIVNVSHDRGTGGSSSHSLSPSVAHSLANVARQGSSLVLKTHWREEVSPPPESFIGLRS